MDTKKYEIEIDDFEHRMLVQALSEKRNELISEGKSTANIDAVETAARYGISRDRAVNYNADGEGTHIL